MARRPGQLTEEDKLKLHRQKVHPDCQDELDIIRAKFELYKGNKIVEIKSGQSMSREEIIENITHLLNTTQNDGGEISSKYISIIMNFFASAVCGIILLSLDLFY